MVMIWMAAIVGAATLLWSVFSLVGSARRARDKQQGVNVYRTSGYNGGKGCSGVGGCSSRNSAKSSDSDPNDYLLQPYNPMSPLYHTLYSNTDSCDTHNHDHGCHGHSTNDHIHHDSQIHDHGQTYDHSPSYDHGSPSTDCGTSAGDGGSMGGCDSSCGSGD